jgi:ribosome-associated protein
MTPVGAAPIRVTGSLAIDPDEIQESFVRAAGPGGQHVNTTSTAVQLRFDVRRSPSLPDDVRHRLERLAGRCWWPRVNAASCATARRRSPA